MNVFGPPSTRLTNYMPRTSRKSYEHPCHSEFCHAISVVFPQGDGEQAQLRSADE